jgi:hypothetical protein
LETYKKTRNIDQEGLREEARPVAESRLRRSLVLLEVSQAEGIQIEKEELQAETERTLEAMTRFMSESEMRKVSNDELIPNLVGNILAEMKMTRTLERMRSISSGMAETEAPDGAGETSGEAEPEALEETPAMSAEDETETSPPAGPDEAQPAAEASNPAQASSQPSEEAGEVVEE